MQNLNLINNCLTSKYNICSPHIQRHSFLVTQACVCAPVSAVTSPYYKPVFMTVCFLSHRQYGCLSFLSRSLCRKQQSLETNSSAAPHFNNKPVFEGYILPTHHLILWLHVSMWTGNVMFIPLYTETKQNLFYSPIIEFGENAILMIC